jgi:alpha-glucosidase
MENVPVPPEMVQDPFGKALPEYGRDPARTPMQWDASPNAGFTEGEPWLPLEEHFARRNVASQRKDPDSMLALYRDLIALRRSEPALTVGNYRGLNAGGSLVAYTREHEGHALLVALNLASEPATFVLPEPFRNARVIISTNRNRDGSQVRDELRLAADEGSVLESID